MIQAAPQPDDVSTSLSQDSERLSFVQADSNEDHGDAVPLSWKLWTSSDPYKYALPKKGDHWEEVMKRVDQYDDGMCRGWREDIDTLLVFAGLFSAAVTAFLIESYKWLQPASTGSTNELLLQISLLLQNTNNSVPRSFSETDASSSASSSISSLSIRVNIFWFSSLSLSLSTAIIGILSKQWLREYRSASATLSPKDALMLRQIRLEALEKWRVVEILSSLPLLLQAALVLFFAGLLDLLWSLNHIVALVLTCEIGIAILFLAMTTIMPSFTIIFRTQRPCAYKSAQAWIFYRTLSWILHTIHSPRFTFRFKAPPPAKDWTAGDRISGRFTSRTGVSASSEPNDCLGKAMYWVYSEYRDNLSMTCHTFHCLEELEEDMLAIAINYAPEHPKSRYYIYNTLLKNLPFSKERQLFALELLIRDINSNSTNHALQATYLSRLYAELRFAFPTVNLDDELAKQIIHTLRFYLQCATDGPALSYNTIHDISYLFLCCWRDSSPPIRRYYLLCLDELERAISKLPDHTSQVRFGFDFAWLISRAMETNETAGVYDSLICSERFRRFFKFLDEFATVEYKDANGVHTSVPLGWKEQKASLAMQVGLDADYFDPPLHSVNC